ncbi:MAG: rhodanese-like domain-containing protein, partial [Spirochaetota bacterium]|nr:rhodanese-like domain-containing protein [Spirochaetota bacterium]
MNIRLFVTILLIIITLAGCGVKTSGEKGTVIISAKEAIAIISEDDIILVDARSSMDFKKGHIENAVNISRADIVVNAPYPNMLCSPKQLEKAMSKNG